MTGKNVASWLLNRASLLKSNLLNLTKLFLNNGLLNPFSDLPKNIRSPVMKKLLPTSTAGSLPKPSWIAQPETLWSPWKLEGQELVDGKLDALRLCLEDQQQAGIDIVSDGEQTRQHFVTTFIEHLEGVDFEKREIVKIRNRYEASVPTVVGPVSRKKSVFVEDAKFLRKQTSQPIKWALPGPMTMIDTLYDLSLIHISEPTRPY